MLHLSGKPLKSVDHFTYISSNILSAESDVNIYIAKACITIHWLSLLWKSDL